MPNTLDEEVLEIKKVLASQCNCPECQCKLPADLPDGRCLPCTLGSHDPEKPSDEEPE